MGGSHFINYILIYVMDLGEVGVGAFKFILQSQGRKEVKI